MNIGCFVIAWRRGLLDAVAVFRGRLPRMFLEVTTQVGLVGEMKFESDFLNREVGGLKQDLDLEIGRAHV